MKKRSSAKLNLYMNPVERFCEKWADRVLFVFMGAYVVLFSFLCFIKYYSFGYYDWDFASDVTILWNSLHGRLLYYPFFEQNILGTHLFLIYFLIIPIYFIFQHPLTLLFLQSLILGLGAYPLYLLAKSKLNKTFSLTIALGYLLYPSVGFINLFETHFDSYAIFFLFFALYYFQKENFFKFLIFLLLAIICKESVSLVVFMLGIYALLRRRPKKWIFIPSLLGIAWFFLAIKIIIPYFAKDSAKLYQGGFIFSAHYQHLGKNISDMVKTIIMHPIATAKYAFIPRKILYLFQLFLPVGFLSFLSPAVLLISLPIFMQNLLSAAPTLAAIHYQYVALLVPFIFYASINGVKKLLNYQSIYKYQALLLSGFFASTIISGIYLKAPQLYFTSYIKNYRINESVKEKDKLLKMIPKNASVITTFQFLPKLANRYHLYSLHLVSTGFKMYSNTRYEPPPNLEYALIDFNEPLMIGSFFPPWGSDNIRSFLEDGGWGVLKAVDDIVLFKKGLGNENKLCEIVTNPKIQKILNVNFNNQIIFLGYNIEGKNSNQDRILHLVYYWKRKGQINREIGFFIQFLDSYGKIILQKVRVLGYRVYIPRSWPEGQIIKENNYIFVPSNLGKGTYNIRLGLFYLDNNEILPVISGVGTDGAGRIILGDIGVS